MLKLKPQPIDFLLGSALMAQAPHAAEVFVCLAMDPGILTYVHGYAYALALEGATFFFVRRRMNRWAYVFAAASILHNVVYYMPPGLWRYVVGAAVICLGLPLAVVAFSHERAESGAMPEKATPAPIPAKVEKVAQRPAQAAKNSALTIDMQAAILDAIKCGASTQAAVAEVVGVHPTTIGRNIAPLRESGLIHRNGNGWEIGESA